MRLEELLSSYGYWAILAGCFFEGETVLVIGGFAAYQGYLHLPWVIVAAYGGTLLGDQLYFYLGRVYGQRLLKRRPYWQSRVGKVQGLLKRFQTSLILLFRFLYGIRAITPFVIGMSGISPRKFLVFNALGALIWAVLVGSGGYVFGTVLEGLLGNVKKYERLILGLMFLTGVLVWAAYIYFRRKRPADVPENKGRQINQRTNNPLPRGH